MTRPSVIVWKAEVKFEEWWQQLNNIEKTQVVATGAVVFIYLASVLNALSDSKRHRVTTLENQEVRSHSRVS